MTGVLPDTVPDQKTRPEQAQAGFLRRAGELGVSVPAPVRWGRVVVDLSTYTAAVDGAALEMSARQVELLALFLATPGRVWSRDQLHWVCWGDVSRSRRVDVQLCRLWARLDIDLFRNIRDRGWALRAA